MLLRVLSLSFHRLLASAVVGLLGGCVSIDRTADHPAVEYVARAEGASENSASAELPAASPEPMAPKSALANDADPAADVKPKTEIPTNAKDSRFKPNVEIRGRIQADAIFVNQSPGNKEAIGNIDNAVGFRRARLGAQGNVCEQANFIAEFDFAGGNIAFRDFYAQAEELPYIRRARVGHFREPFSLEGFTSANVITFTERSQINTLDPARNWGVGAFSYTDNERAVFQAGAFRSGTSNNTGNDIGDDNDMAYTIRVTGLPWYEAACEGSRLMHVGGAFSQRNPKNNLVTINSGTQNSLIPDTDSEGSPFVPVIMIPATQFQLYNAQWALVLGSLSFQAEWTGTTIESIGNGTIFLNGCYAYVSYFLTGEHRRYDRKDGAFDVTPVRSPFVCRSGSGVSVHGWGAWELATRIAYSNFESPNMPPTAAGMPQGDREIVMTSGVNWYLCDNARLMFNYVHAVPVVPGFGSSNADAFFFRTAVFW